MITDAPDIDVHLAARFAEMPVEEFIALNPGFSRPLIRASATRRIILPADKVAAFYDNLDDYDEGALVSWQVYKPERGEKLEAIAKRFEISVAELKRVNGIRAQLVARAERAGGAEERRRRGHARRAAAHVRAADPAVRRRRAPCTW